MIDLLERLTHSAIAVPLIVIVLYNVYNNLTAKPSVPGNLPWIGRKSTGFFAETKAHLASFSDVPGQLAEGYAKYTKKGLSYILPDFSGHPELILPPSQIKWLLEQPDNVLSASEFHYDSLAGDYAFTTPQILKDPYHEHVIHKYLPRRIGPMIPDLWEEVGVGFDESWALDTKNYKEIPVYNSVMFMISRAVNRMIVGLPLCRNEDYLENARRFAMDIIFTTSLKRFTPRIFWPFVGPVASLPNNWHYRNTLKYTVPIIEERKKNYQEKKEDPTFDWIEPNDFIQWSIELATTENRPDELTTDMLTRRLMPINFASIHTTTIAVTNCLFDLIASDPSKGYLEGIREEAERVLASEPNGIFSKAGLARCHRGDSALRESMRVSNFMSRNLIRRVMPAEGIENKAQGWTAPEGAFMGVDINSLMHDPEIYTAPNTYDAFRFSRPREEQAASEKESLEMKNTGLVTTSEIWLPFSHGRHACPGRFLIANEVKMMLAYMVLHYDIEPLEARPKNTWFSSTCVPPMKETVRVRRREGTVGA